jgi:hypothetical protein
MEIKVNRIIVFFFLYISSCHVRDVSGYCWAAGRNPGFSGPPKVEQIKIDVVRVSWENVVTLRECADNFVVKYWPRSAPNQYDITDLVPTSDDFVDITVIPKIIYQFQAVAREDKGIIGGVDWNKSPTVDYKTSSFYTKPSSSASSSSSSSSTSEGSSSSSGSSSNKVDQTMIDDGRPMAVLGMSLEIFIAVVVISLLVVLIVVGLAYKLVSGHRKTGDLDDDDDDDDDDDNDDDDDEEAAAAVAPTEDEDDDAEKKEKEKLDPIKNIP